MDHSQEPLTALSLCTGGRGLERGVERVTGPLRTVAFVEIEAALVENLVVGMEKDKLAPAPIWPNARTFPFRYFRHKIFLLLAGYPCQPFSTAGKRQGTDDPRHLWPTFECGVDTVRPVCVYFENVLGHLTLGFDHVTESLRAMGYAVEAGIFTAAEVGAPHKRARIFILGILADAKDYVRGLYERQWRPGASTMDAAGTSQAMAYAGGAEWRQIDLEEDRATAWKSRIFSSGPQNASGPEQCSKIVADSIGQGLAVWEEQPARQERSATERSGYVDRWPARPGEPQYAWEEPRTLEPGVGLSADGYNYREDLLRALGNGVVEQQAEYALRQLLKKHFP